MTKTIFAASAAVPANVPKPKNAATNAITKKIIAHTNMIFPPFPLTLYSVLFPQKNISKRCNVKPYHNLTFKTSLIRSKNGADAHKLSCNLTFKTNLIQLFGIFGWSEKGWSNTSCQMIEILMRIQG